MAKVAKQERQIKLQNFHIEFDDAEVNPQAVYRAGQTISFKIHLRLEQPVKCRAIYVKLYGGSYVYWTESRTVSDGDDTRTETDSYSSEERYINTKVSVYTPDSQGPSANYHPAGLFVYPVCFEVPSTAPSSFESDVGHIRYCIKANVDRPWNFDFKTVKFYTVIRDFDLNLRPPGEIGPFRTENDFDVNCCLCFNCCCGKVRVNVALPKKAYVPGEHVHVTGEIQNTSSTDLTGVSLEISQYCLYITPGKNRTDCRVVSNVVLPGVRQGGSMRLDHMLPVNPVPSSHTEGCNNIRVHYYFRLNADGGCCLSARRECCELLIGTVPLRSAVAPELSIAASGSGAQPFEPPPPSYHESMFGPVNMGKDDGEVIGDQGQWAPSYPWYQFPSAPPPT